MISIITNFETSSSINHVTKIYKHYNISLAIHENNNMLFEYIYTDEIEIRNEIYGKYLH